MKKLILTVIISALTFGVYAQNKTFTLPENKGDKLNGQELKEEDMPVILYIYKKINL